MAKDTFLTEEVKKKWKPILEHKKMPEIESARANAVTIMLENQHDWMLKNGMGQSIGKSLEEASTDPVSLAGGGGTTPGNGNIDNWDPVLISLVRRSTPNLLAFDIAGVQPMTGPTGLIFALRSRYTSPSGAEALFDEANSAFSGAQNGDSSVYGAGSNTVAYAATTVALGTAAGGAGTDDTFTVDVAGEGTIPAGFQFSPFDTVTVSNLNSGTVVSATPVNGTSNVVIVTSASADGAVTGDIDIAQYDFGTGIDTDVAEILGGSGTAWNEMSFSIERTQVTAQSRALKASYSVELAQDLRAIHGLDAATELSNILTAELLQEQNREMIRRVNYSAKLGGTNDSGFFDVQGGTGDFQGRWFAEKWKRLLFQIELEANKIAVDTRRGKGNWIICSADVASALGMAGQLDHTPALSGGLNVDVTGNLFAGVLIGKYRVYIDPFAPINYVTVGFRGQNQYDAGIYYAPYVPLEMYKAQGEDNFQPRMGFKTRYGIVANPFVETTAGVTSGLGKNENYYFRKFAVKNLY